jgi:succinyl-diaminopimelate desuccinylase
VTPAKYIDRNSAAVVRRLRRLVGISTVNPPGENYDEITAWLGRELRSLGLRSRRFTVPAALLKRSLPPEQLGFPRFNVLGQLAAKGTRQTLHFNAHYDVVPVSGQWRHGSPFSGAIECRLDLRARHRRHEGLDRQPAARPAGASGDGHPAAAQP